MICDCKAVENDVACEAYGSSCWQLHSLVLALMVLLRSATGLRFGGCPGRSLLYSSDRSGSCKRTSREVMHACTLGAEQPQQLAAGGRVIVPCSRCTAGVWKRM